MEKLEVKGRVFQIIDPITGESAKGPWKKQEFVIETMDQYPKKVSFQVWNDKVKLPKVDDIVIVSFNPESNEYNGNWYTNLTAWRIELNSADVADKVNEQVNNAPAEIVAPAEDGLPF